MKNAQKIPRKEMSLQVELLERSFEAIKPQADAFVASFYDHLFTAYPEAQSLFANAKMQEQQKKLLSIPLVIPDLFLSSKQETGGSSNAPRTFMRHGTGLPLRIFLPG